MSTDTSPRAKTAAPASPMDPFLVQALQWLRDREHLTVNEIGRVMAEHLGWPIGFAETVVAALRVNRLCVGSPWEPNKLHVSRRGIEWLDEVESGLQAEIEG
jgi:hypothetical protein